MDRPRDHALSEVRQAGELQDCIRAYGAPNHVATAFRRKALFSEGILSSREPFGLLSASLYRPADVFVPPEAGCTFDADGRYSSATFDVTVRGVKPDGDGSGPALQAASRAPGGAAVLAETEKNPRLSRMETEVSLSLRRNDATKWIHPFQFHPFAIDVFGALGPAAEAAVDQFARVQGRLLHLDDDYYWKGILQELSVALHSTNAKVLRRRRPQLSVMDEGPDAQEE